MKKWVLILAAIFLLLAGCDKAGDANTVQPETSKDTAQSEVSNDAAQKEPAVAVQPLPDTTMENLTDAILSVSLEEGKAYVDDTGKMQMDVKIFSYDRYDMLDISKLKVGDILVTHGGDVEITALERNESGTLYINGGLEEGGFDLVEDESGIYYETGFNDAKNWYEVGEATIRVSADFEGRDNSDPEQGEVVIYPGDFLTDGVKDYNFTPYNTTIRVEEGQIVELNRAYMP